jgi:hypothetical protein
VAAELQGGRLLVVVDLGDGELIFPAASSPPINDGNSHLVQVKHFNNFTFQIKWKMGLNRFESKKGYPGSTSIAS